MLLDSNLQFETGVAITATRVGTNVIDMGVRREIAYGEPMHFTCVSDGLFAAAGAATLQVALQGSVDNSTFTDYALSPVLSIATLNAKTVGAGGFVFPVDWPARPSGVGIPRYFRLNLTVATGPFTAGSLQAWLNLGAEEIYFYPRNYTV